MPGLLFDEYVERGCARDNGDMGPDAAEVARRRRNCSGYHWSDERPGGVLAHRSRACFERKLGDDGRAMDSMAGATRDAHVSLACNSAGAGDYRCFSRASLTAGTLLYLQTA